MLVQDQRVRPLYRAVAINIVERVPEVQTNMTDSCLQTRLR